MTLEDLLEAIADLKASPSKLILNEPSFALFKKLKRSQCMAIRAVKTKRRQGLKYEKTH